MSTSKPPNTDTNGEGLSGLKSAKSVQRLEQISSLRARGIAEDIDLPQLVVCGDQSAGKSSVLEGLSGIPFPRDEGVCTKFATEVILEHGETSKAISATIIPHVSRSDATKMKLRQFERHINDFTELPDVIANAGALMGLRGYGDNVDGPAFVEDVLRIRVVNRSGLHLSIVDLPGLISVASEEQTEEDVSTVRRMVDTYIEKPRTIILAVVQASNDIANQSIIRTSKQFDKAGQRTVGIITKPDLINEGAEARIASLAKNVDTTRLELGFFLLKNPAPKEMQNGITLEQRSANELRFFQSSPWKEQKLNPERVGIQKLRAYLQTLLDKHIEKELPKVREEIRAMILTTESDIARLPKERPTTGHLRMFLADLAMQYHTLATAALNGDYHTTGVEFFSTNSDETESTRLRALVHRLNTEFSDRMRNEGKMLKLSKRVTNNPNAISDEAPPQPDDDHDPYTEENAEKAVESRGKFVTESEMKAWVTKTYMTTRGRELAGDHLEEVYDSIAAFVKKAVAHLKIEDQVLLDIRERTEGKLLESKKAAEDELARLCADELQQPITYNHYYTDNVQKSRQSAMQKALEQAVDHVHGPNSANSTYGMGPATLTDEL